ncbi:hypothetical protein BVRB_029500 [Beta vulgaris subsp. vulgaris]|uniref:Uncharacterized protein n=1 Tax=Beta vulgaris subsp. vulgaris TaxID=3555 RepID=A0A0J8AXS9_BETVV|nr:hypothetical protein BVRB_029500 [Beta vulgaris subsp. vulgaris]
MAVQSSLRDTDSTVRQAGLIMGAAFSVVSQGETVDLALSSMIDLSRDRNADVRMEFSNQINFLGKSHPNVLLTRTDVLNQVVNVLLALINDGSQSVSLASQNALGHTLQLHRGRTHTFDSYLKTVDVNTSAALDKFARRSRLFRSVA